MKKGFKALVSVLVLALAGGLFAGCHHHRHSYHGNPEKMAEKLEKHLDRALSKIDATEEQRNRIHLIAGEIIEDARATRKESAGGHGRILDSLLLDNPDREYLHQRLDEKAEAMTEFGHRTVDRLIEISAVLTPAQRAELQERFESAHGAEKQ